jgi:twinfilin-like protein
MLFASTRLSLARELGIERFRETIFATEARELTAEGFKRHDAHVKLEAPLTVEEQSLGEVRRAELEAGAGSGVKKSHLSSHFSMSVADDALSALKALGQGEGGNNLVQLRIDTKTEVIELDSTTSTTLSALSSAISSSEPRYSFFRFSPETIIFIYTCPSGSKIKERMLYASSRLGVTAYAEQEAGITIAKKLEASEPGELSEEAIEEEFRPKVEVKRAFDRPRRPGRR